MNLLPSPKAVRIAHFQIHCVSLVINLHTLISIFVCKRTRSLLLCSSRRGIYICHDISLLVTRYVLIIYYLSFRISVVYLQTKIREQVPRWWHVRGPAGPGPNGHAQPAAMESVSGPNPGYVGGNNPQQQFWCPGAQPPYHSLTSLTSGPLSGKAHRKLCKIWFGPGITTPSQLGCAQCRRACEWWKPNTGNLIQPGRTTLNHLIREWVSRW